MSTALAYLAGVLVGDGWCGKDFGLRVKDRDFAETFAVAVELAYGCYARSHADGKYWRVVASNRTGRYDGIRSYEPTTEVEQAAWLRGLFDSEGNAQLRPSPGGHGGWGRRVAFYSTNTETLVKASVYLDALDIANTTRSQKSSTTHLGSLPVYELSIRASRENFLRFAWLVGSSIQRKRDVLFRLPLTYEVDLVASMRAAQRLGAQAKHRKTMEQTLPLVVQGVRLLIDNGISPTQRNCRAISGYTTVQRHVSQGELIRMALAI